jgi:hypothetical protein
MRPPLTRLPGLALALSLALAPSSALAEEPLPKPVDKSNSQFTLNRDDRGQMLGDQGRARARAGDCKGALAAFDAAILINFDPRLRRDRGLCHERLGHVYPAMEDFRVYVTARPDAPDAEQIRERLVRLEAETGTAGERRDDGVKSSGPREAPVMSANYNAVVKDREESENDVESPLRAGTGAIFGPYFSLRSFFLGKAPSTLGYGVGGTLRYATSRSFTLYIDGGYAALGESGTPTAAGGPAVYGGGELRLGLGRHYADAFHIGGAIGVERYTTSRTKAVATNLIFRARPGYRHTFGANFAFEIEGDVGFGPVSYSNLPTGDTRSGETQLLLGGTMAILIGF